MLVGAALGVDWEKVRERMVLTSAPDQKLEAAPMRGPSIAELAEGLTPPKSLGSPTMEVSVEVLKRLTAPKQMA